MTWIPSFAQFDDRQVEIFNEILDDSEGSWWIQGYAGTGKTMMLIHLIHEFVISGWDCAYVTYTHALKNLAIESVAELGHKKGKIQTETVDTLNSLNRRYDIIFVDEVQDLTKDKLLKLNKLADRLIYAGDINQSIFCMVFLAQSS